jgi:hypothetical protein
LRTLKGPISNTDDTKMYILSVFRKDQGKEVVVDVLLCCNYSRVESLLRKYNRLYSDCSFTIKECSDVICVDKTFINKLSHAIRLHQDKEQRT